MNKYQEKDIKKFKICNKLISRGGMGFSSAQYAYKGVGDIAPINVNCGKYVKQDVVGISVNGIRFNALGIDKQELYKALEAKVTIVKDNRFNTYRSYNVGERTVKELLINNDYVCIKNDGIRSIWKHELEI